MPCLSCEKYDLSANGINNATEYNVNQGIMQLVNNF